MKQVLWESGLVSKTGCRQGSIPWLAVSLFKGY
jgi:hypothetical protein